MKPLSGRIVCVIGLPCTGKSTIIDMVINSSREILAKISSGDIARKLSTNTDIQHMARGNLFPHEGPLRAEILKLINKRRAQGSEIIFLDGVPRHISQVQWLMDNQLAGTIMEGCIIHVRSTRDQLFNRAINRMRDNQDEEELIRKKIAEQSKLLEKVDQAIIRFGIPYYTVMNDDLYAAIKQTAKFIGLRK